jgi:hypothetical protein
MLLPVYRLIVVLLVVLVSMVVLRSRSAGQQATGALVLVPLLLRLFLVK